MHIENLLKNASSQLSASEIGTARLDALVLLEDCLGKDRSWLLAHPEYKISADQVAKLQKLLTRRANHEPLAYIRGHTEFYGREFVLTSAVLEPRPESETMIDLLKALAASESSGLNNVSGIRLADVGTGSGALGITAALELPKCSSTLIDIDPQALEVAKINVDKFTAAVEVVLSNLLEETHQEYDVLLCNLPYVPDDYAINTAASHEPRLAIFGGPDGLDVYRNLFNQISQTMQQPLYILTESLPPQHSGLATIAGRCHYQLDQKNDFIQVFKRTN